MKYTRLKPRLHLLLLKKQFFEEIKLKLFLEWIRKLKHFNVSVCTRELRRKELKSGVDFALTYLQRAVGRFKKFFLRRIFR